MSHQVLLGYIVGNTPGLTLIMGIIQPATAMGAPGFSTSFAKILVNPIKNTKKADISDKFC